VFLLLLAPGSRSSPPWRVLSRLVCYGWIDVSVLAEVSQDSNHWLGTYGPLQIVFWTTGEVSPEVCERMLKVAKEMTRRSRGSRPAVLSITCPTLQRPPSSRSRRTLAALVEAGSDRASRVAVVYEGQGFIASFALSVFAGIQMLVRPHHGYRFFGALGDALRWVTEDLPEFRSGALRYEAARLAIEGQSRRVRTQWLANQEHRSGLGAGREEGGPPIREETGRFPE
jgi:hypothetical protein